ncbi:MAG: 2-heptaprenyl,4-naphthoquinone methyltransferase [Myxococcales bacterium]|nr:2-heptaprenyl,4-naphthoquinone methyltransferase [Myxococcales bacterium]
MPSHRLLTAEEVWRKYDAVESRLTAPVSERMLDLASLTPGMRVLDLATGRGEPAVRAAERVGPTGHVLGVDPSDGLLQMAREKAARAGLSNLELHAVDAEALDRVAPAAHFDAATSRWGLMSMTSPVAALESAHRALKPDAILVAALWAEPDRVPYYTLPRRLLARYRPLPPFDPEAPGTFRYADPQRIARDFGRAGFTIEHTEESDVPVIEADTGAELAAWVREALWLTLLLNDLSDDDQQRWEDDLTRAVEPLRSDGRIRLGGVTRIVVARARR